VHRLIPRLIPFGDHISGKTSGNVKKLTTLGACTLPQSWAPWRVFGSCESHPDRGWWRRGRRRPLPGHPSACQPTVQHKPAGTVRHSQSH